MYTIKNMSKTKFESYLRLEKACAVARRWCKGKTLKEAWSRSTRHDWMLWLIWKQLGLVAQHNVYCQISFSGRSNFGARIRKVVKVVQ